MSENQRVIDTIRKDKSPQIATPCNSIKPTINTLKQGNTKPNIEPKSVTETVEKHEAYPLKEILDSLHPLMKQLNQELKSNLSSANQTIKSYDENIEIIKFQISGIANEIPGKGLRLPITIKSQKNELSRKRDYLKNQQIRLSKTLEKIRLIRESGKELLDARMDINAVANLLQKRMPSPNQVDLADGEEIKKLYRQRMEEILAHLKEEVRILGTFSRIKLPFDN